MEEIGATKARNNFQDVIDRVHYTREPVVISKRGKKWVSVRPLDSEKKEGDGDE